MKQRGFTLLEVLIALAILGAALVVLLRLSTSDVRASYHARMLTIATGLAQSKMEDVEELLLHDGFQDQGQDDKGDFSEDGQPKFAWHYIVEKVELPEAPPPPGQDPSQAQPPPSPTDDKNASQLMGLAGGSESGALGAGMVQMYFPLIRPVLENAIRKVTVEITWGKGEDNDEKLKVIAFFVDPKAIDMATGGMSSSQNQQNQQNQQTGTAGAGGGSNGQKK